MSKADVNKIVELVLSDDETNQELGVMMAVSQGVKDEVLKKIHNNILILIRVKLKFAAVDFECYKMLNVFSNKIVTYVEAFELDGIEPRLVYISSICEKAERYLKLKNYNHE